MRIYKAPARLFKYVFKFKYTEQMVNYCRSLKLKVGRGQFGFYQNEWRFNDLNIMTVITRDFPEVAVDMNMMEDIEKFEIEQKQLKIRLEKAEKLKTATDSDINITGIKGELYPYQKVGVEFFINNEGRAILSDQMGCLSGDTKIIVNRCKNARQYKISEIYSRMKTSQKNHPRWKKDIKLYTRSLNEETGEFRLNEIVDIIEKGKQEVIQITAMTNKKKYVIKLTPDHEVITKKRKWVEAGKLKKGDEILVNGKLMKYCPRCRKKTEHATFLPDIAKITSIKKVKQEIVYDIVMADPHRNFVANGIVVHNCGKTLQTLAYVTTERLKKTLVISPASVKYVWEKEVKKWTKLSPFILESNGPSFTHCEHSKHDIFIINYDILKRYFNEIHALQWDILVADEFQYIKNNAAQRTKLVKMIATRIPRVLLLSGTPLLNRPVELFNGLYLMDPVKWNDWFSFTKRYCKGKKGFWGGWEAKGASNIEELQQRIGRYFLRRRKEDVLKELPPKTFIDVPVIMKPEERKIYKTIIEDFKTYLKETKGIVQKDSQATKLVKLNELRQFTTASKYKTALEIITDIVDSGEKVTVFSVYNEPLVKLKEEFKTKAVLLTGKTNAIERKNSVEKFQNDKKVQVFLGGMKSAGVGITLTEASNCLFIDYSWVPADHDQAQDRIHRPGQKAKNVTIYQLFAKDTIDAYMQEMLVKKKELFDRLIDNPTKKINTKKNVINDLLDLIEKTK